MRTTLVVVVALVVLLGAALVIALLGGDAASPAPGVGAEARDALPTVQAAFADQPPAVVSDANRVPAAPAVQTVSLRLRCVDRQGAPVGGCRVGIAPHAGDVTAPPPHAPRWTGVTANDGTCSIALDDHRDGCVVWIRGEGLATVHGWLPADPARERDLGDVVVHPGRQVRGRVVTSDARAVADVRFEVHRGQAGAPKLQPRLQFTATSDSSGAFGFDEPLMTGAWRIQVPMAQLVSEPVFTVGSGPGPQDLEFVVVPPEAVILGVVVDDRGEPVPRANVWATVDDRHVSMQCQTGDDGSFVLARNAQVPVKWKAPGVRLVASRTGMESAVPVEATWGERAARLVLRRGIGLSLLLRDEDGAPVEAAKVELASMSSGYPGMQAARSGPFPGGRVVLGSVIRGEAWLRVTPADPRLVQPECLLIRIGDQGPFEHTITLVRAFSRPLHVTTPDGTPVAGSTFELVRLSPGKSLTAFDDVQMADGLAPGPRNPNTQCVGEQRGETDANGTATLYCRAASGLAVRVRGAAHVPAIANDVRLDEAAPLEIVVSNGGSVRVQLGPPELLAGLRLQAQRLLADDPRLGARARPSLSLSRAVAGSANGMFGANVQSWPPYALARARVEIDEAGKWQTSGVPEGRWSLMLTLPGGDGAMAQPTIQRLLDTFDVAEGQAIERTCLRPDLVPAHVDGRLIVDDHTPTKDATMVVYVRSFPPGGGFQEQYYRVPVARDGSFGVSGMAGDWTLQPSWRDATHGVILAQAPDKLTLACGEQRRVEVALRMGRATLVLRDGAGRPVAGAKPVLLFADGRFRIQLEATDAEGRTQTPLLEDAAFDVLVLPRRLLTDAAQREFAKTAGQLWRLELGKQMVRCGVVTSQPQGVVVELEAPPQFEQ